MTIFSNAKNKNSILKNYYRNQIVTGRGAPDYFRSSRLQRGHGLGSVLAGLAKTGLKLSKPYLKKGLKTAVKSASSVGANVLGDLLSGQNFNDSVKNRAADEWEVKKRQAVKKLKKVLIPPRSATIHPRRGGRPAKRKKSAHKTRRRRRGKSDNFGRF